MNFNFTVGNPPFQQETTDKSDNNGQKSRKNVFHYFQIAADQLATQGSVLIYPGGRWIHQSGKGMKEFGLEQMNDHSMSSLEFYPNGKEVFGEAADLADGVSIVTKNKARIKGGYETFAFTRIEGGKENTIMVPYPGSDLMPLDPDDIVIQQGIKTLLSKCHIPTLHSRILPRSLFGIESDYVSKNPNKVHLYKEGELLNNNEIKVFTNDKAGKAGRAKWYVMNISDLPKGKDTINKWKVAVSSANAGGQKRDWQLSIMDNQSVFGRTRVGLGAFDTEQEAKNFYKYLTTSFIRYAFLMTDEALTTLGKMVPDLGDYTDECPIVTFDDTLNDRLFELAEIPLPVKRKMELKIAEIDEKRGKKNG